MLTPRRRRRVALAAAAILGITAAGAAGPAGASVPGEPRVEPQPQKIASELLSRFQEDATQDFWVRLTRSADTSAAQSIDDWAERGQFVYDGRRAFAERSQADTRAVLDELGVAYDPYWIVNAIRVHEGTAAQALELSAVSSVGSIFAPVEYEPIEPTPGRLLPPVDAVEWGIADINADDVWDEFGARGEGIVIANIDTGVDYTHPALVDQYRGNLGDGEFDHNYNWYAADGSGSDEPTDIDGHGTHTMGTLVGDDSGDNQIGVAPGATWIAAGHIRSERALLNAMEWMLAPRDLSDDEATADPSKRPHIVSNSWGIPFSPDPFGEEIQEAWNDAGMFGVFASGNEGPACETGRSPSVRVINYAVGAYDIDNLIADFSSRGPGQDGETKPNISAPGVDVRSSLPGGDYAAWSGTSMATPHVAGAVGLLWSAAPAMIGDIEGTRALLDETAVDMTDTSCGGTPEDNNVWGEGRLDALALVQSAAVGSTGILRGKVASAESGDPIANARLTISGPEDLQIHTAENGTYRVRLPVGSYDVEAWAFGYVEASASADVERDEATRRDFRLDTAETYSLRGRVRDERDNAPVEGTTVTLVGTPLSTQTNAAGRYVFPEVPAGRYRVAALGGNCARQVTRRVSIADGPERRNFRLPVKTDGYGYSCAEEAAGYVEAENVLPLTGDDMSYPVELPFRFRLYGGRYPTVHVSVNGYLDFLAPSVGQFNNTPIPEPSRPNATIAPFWDDLVIDDQSSVRASEDLAGPGSFTIEYRDAVLLGDPGGGRVDFQVTLHKNGDIVFAYRGVDPASALERGQSATVGIENADGTDGLEYSYNEAVLDDGAAIRFRPPPNGSARPGY